MSLGHSFHSPNDKPLKGFRRSLFTFLYRCVGKSFVFLGGIRVEKHVIDYDYSVYLGPNYRETQVPPKHLSMYVANHSSWMDVEVMLSNFKLAFAAKKAFIKMPVFGLVCAALGCVFISRGASQEKRNQIVEQICHRQKVVEDTDSFPPLCIFPEGGTTNGRHLIAFKRGAFASLRPVKPVVLKYAYGMLSPAWDVIPFLPLLFMQMSLFDFKCTVKELPLFIPNEYLFTTHSDKGNDRWEIYAWAIREIMADVGPFTKNEQPYREKLYYESCLGFIKEKKVVTQSHLGKNVASVKEPLL